MRTFTLILTGLTIKSLGSVLLFGLMNVGVMLLIYYSCDMYDVCEQISVVERQVFDFFGFMWTCIIINFIQIILVIAGLFGVCQGRAKIVVAVSI